MTVDAHKNDEKDAKDSRRDEIFAEKKWERKHFSERKITQKHKEFSGRAQQIIDRVIKWREGDMEKISIKTPKP